MTSTGAALLLPTENIIILTSKDKDLLYANFSGHVFWQVSQNWGSNQIVRGVMFGETFQMIVYDPDLAGSPIEVASTVVVPEPSPLYIVGFGAVCVYVMGHKRRARRTATTDA